MEQFQTERRRFYRHPISAPIQYHEVRSSRLGGSSSVDLSEGGVCFLADRFLAKGTLLNLKIPVGDRLFTLNGQVAYCSHMPSVDLYRTGVAFLDPTDAFRAKLAEEILRIKEYQKKLSQDLGREVSEEEAAQKWIERYGKQFS